MIERQSELIKKTQEALELLLDSDNSMYPDVMELEIYQIYLSTLATEFPNQETVALGLKLMDMIYNARIHTDFYWIDDIEKTTLISLMFTDLSVKSTV